MLLLPIGIGNLSVESRVLVLLDLAQILHLLLLVAELVANQRQLTLLLHSLVDLLGKLVLIVLLNVLNLLPSLVLDALSLLLMALDHLLNLETQGLLLGLELLALQNLIPVDLLHERLVREIGLRHEHLKLLQILLLLVLQVVVAGLVRLTLLFLIGLLLLKQVAMVVHAPGNLFLVVALHFASFLLNFLHLLAAFELLLLHFADEVFLLLFVAGHERGLFLLAVTFFGLDRFDQVADLLL